MPRLILEARRVAATVIHGLHGRRRAGTGREFLAVPPLRVGRAGRARRLAPLGARRPSLCARAGMGSRAHGVDLAGPLALDGVRLAARLGDQARPRAGGRVRARRGAGRGRRARRHSGPDAPDREPQRHREDGRDDRARSDRAREPAAVVRALAAVRDRGAVRPVEPDRATCTRRIAQLSATGAHGHVVQIVDPAEETFPYSGRVEFIEPEGRPLDHGRPRRGLARRLPGAASSAIAPRSAPRPTGSAGASPSTAPTGRRPSCCCALHAQHGRRRRRHRHQPLARRRRRPGAHA